MENLRLVPSMSVCPEDPCSRCGTGGLHWDRLAGKPFCPDCEEALALGDAAPLVERTEKHCCAACDDIGTIRYLTYPLRATGPVEMDLCPEHFRSLLGRRLGPGAFHQLRRRLARFNLTADQIFLLHEEFYDPNGRALQPIPEVE